MISAVLGNESVQFFGPYFLSTSPMRKMPSKTLWIMIRGFSIAVELLEQYKQNTRKVGQARVRASERN